MIGSMRFDKLMLAGLQYSNPRTSSGLAEPDISELALHIVRHGLMTPLLVTPSGLVIGGQRRYRAIELIFSWAAQLDVPGDEEVSPELKGMTGDEMLRVITAANELRDVPVNALATSGPVEEGGLAIADNVMRESLSSYEVAESLSGLSAQGATGANLARLVGKSPSYVSRKLKLYASAGPELRAAWRTDSITEQTVEGLAYRPHAEQARMLAGGERPGRGPANRPGIETVKDVLGELERAGLATNNPRMEVGDARYAAGVVDALRWATGQQASSAFTKLAAGEVK